MSDDYCEVMSRAMAGFVARPVVAYNPDLARISGSINAGVMLSQMCYWARGETATSRGGWFYKTCDEWQKEIAMTRREQETARRKLRDLGLVEEVKRGVPAKIYFRVNFTSVMNLLANMDGVRISFAKGVGGAFIDNTNHEAKVSQIVEPVMADCANLLQETTQEITTRTKNTMAISDEIPDADDDPNSNDLFGTEQPVDRKTCPWEAILDKWAEIMPDKQQPSKNMWQGTSRANDLAQRWKACFSIKHEATGKPLYTTTEEGIEWWGRFFAYMRKSDFLMGKTGNARWFKLDWIVKKSNFVKIMENHYHQ